MMKDEVLELLEEHAERYPDMMAEDLYKVLHQRILGPGHAVHHKVQAEERLRAEAESLDLANHRGFDEPVEMLDESRELARVHLRPYLRAGGDLRRLLDAFVDTAAELDASDKSELKTALGLTLRLLDAHADELDLAFDKSDFSRVLGKAVQADYPGMSHSEEYREFYAPSYRVVLLSRLVE